MILPSRFQIKSNTLIWILSLYFATVLNLAFYKYVIIHIEITSVSVLCFALSLIVFITAPFYVLFNLILWPYIGKMLIVLLLLISASANYMMFFYGIYIDTDMVRNVFETNTREALDLVTFSGFLWVLITGIMPAVSLMISVVRYRPMKKECVFRLIMVGLCLMVTGAVGALTYKEYAAFGRNHRDVRKLLNTINYTYSTIKYIKLQSLADRKFVILDDKAHLEPLVDSLHTVLIYIVGETARAQNFSLNGYDRETNPLMKKQDIVNFNQVAACGTATAVSLPCMFSNLTRSDFDVTDAKYTENVLDLLEKGGYDIYWRENDDGCKSVCPRVNYIDMQQTKHPKFCKDSYCYDEVLLDGLDEQLNNIKKDTVIVLHMMGSHGPTYYNRYPDEFKRFTPTCDTADIQNCSRQEIINTYDNTIVYTDYIISKAIDLLKKYPQYESGLLYVSDHGESLGENNLYLHGLPYNLAPAEQKQVPMIMWMSENMKKYDYVDYDCLKRIAAENAFSHDNLFHFILGLLEIKTTAYRQDMDILHACRTKPMPF